MSEIHIDLAESEMQVAHAIPGRVRLRAIGGKSVSTLENMEQKLRQQNGVGEVRTNPKTNSLVVTFDVSTISLQEILHGLHIADIAETSGKTKLLPELRAGNLLQEQNKGHLQSVNVAQSIIPLVAGMLVTSALGIEGFLAFPVYLVTENITRQVMKQFDSDQAVEATLEAAAESVVADRVKVAQEATAQGNGKSDRLLTNATLSATIETTDKPVARHPEVPCKVVHAIPGRMRFRVPRIVEDAEYAQKLTTVMEAEAKVTDVRVNVAAASIAISYEADGISDVEMKAHLINLIQTADKIDFPIDLKAASTQPEPQEEPNLWYQIGLPAFTTTLAVLGGPLGLPIPPLIMGGTIAVAALPVAKRAIDSILVEHRLNIDVLDLSAITITTLQGQFISPALMITLVEIGEAIREQTARSSKSETLDLLDSLEQLIWVERNKEKQQISIHEVQRGDVVIVYPGDQIPVDGRIIRGKALIDEQKLTGESMPVMRQKGQTVYTSTLVREGQLYIRTENVGADTRAGQIIKVMQDAPVHDTRIENYAANIADRAVIPTLLLSGIVFGLTRNLARAASVLTLDFATGIRVSVPTTVLAALTYAARRGILIRSGRALEKLAQVDAVVFDKTGTLTQGEAVIVSVETENSTSPLQVLELAAAAEQRLTHPVAEAVVRYAQEQGARHLSREKWEYEIGLGVRAKIDGQAVLVGSEYFLRQEGVHLNGMPEKHSQESHSVIYVASNGELQGTIAYRDPVRPESRDVIKALRATKGMEIHLLTGDNQRTASAVARELGIAETHTHAEAFPEQKVAVVESLHAQGKTVAFVGDGINDSPALAYADVSVSFANGSDVARETADVVLMENDLRGLPEAIAIARQAMQLIHQNTGIVAVPNLAALVLAVAVGIDPLAATLVNNGSTIVAGLNGLRPLLESSEDLKVVATSLDTTSKDPEAENLQTSEAIAQASDRQPIPEIQSNLQQPLETSTASFNTVTTEPVNMTENQQIVQDSQGVPSEPLTGIALAHRLNVSDTTISRRKSKPDFPEWTRGKDPNAIAWMYSKQSKLFMPRSPISHDQG
jgi:Cu2+-exporting ATPase